MFFWVNELIFDMSFQTIALACFWFVYS